MRKMKGGTGVWSDGVSNARDKTPDPPALGRANSTDKAKALDVARAPVDIDRLLGDLNSAFNPLHKGNRLDFHVSAAREGYVCVSVALPEGMTRAFVTLLESLHGLVRCVDIKARSAIAQVKVYDPSRIAELERLQTEFREKVLTLFDGYRKAGHDKNESIKLTNKVLKSQGHPWATYETVMGELRSAGRLRKSKACPQGGGL